MERMEKISTFDDWIDYFKKWQKDIGFDPALVSDYKFDAVYEDPPESEVEFGEFAGSKKWDRLLQVPTQDMRDSLLHLVFYQGDTEFASSEQQRGLIEKAPSPYDLKCLLRVMREEMRHGWQMSHVLIKHFGDAGKLEARKLLERRAYEGTRLLGAFNQPMEHWLDFFTYTCFIDRDGKYQLTMLHHSGFAPLASSMGPMLKEEAFHLFTGQSGLTRIMKAGKIPAEIVQKYLNKWLSTGLDLFGKDYSTSVRRFFNWGLKGRFNEAKDLGDPKEAERLNDDARRLYRAEACEIVRGLNMLVPADQPELYVPDLKFHRAIGDYAGKTYSVHGEELSTEDYEKHLAQVLPGPEDEKKLEAIFKEGNWIMEVREEH